MARSLDQIARIKKLTPELLYKEVLSQTEELKIHESKIYNDILYIALAYGLVERVVVYCFMRLWRKGQVKNFNFATAFDKNRTGSVKEYLDYYYRNLSESQDILWRL